MKKIALVLCIVLLAAFTVVCFAGCNTTESTTNRLVIYNWEDYIEPEILESFKEYYKSVTGIDIEIVYTTFDTNETMMTKMLQGDAVVDLICPSEYAIERLMSNGLLQNMTVLAETLKKKYPDYNLTFDNFNNVEPLVNEKIGTEFASIKYGDKTMSMNDYMVPYMWGTLGILYNPKYVTEEDLSAGYGLLWNEKNNPKLNGKILVKDSVRDTYCVAVLYMYEYGLLPDGYEDYSVQDLINCTDSAMLEAAEEVLTKQREVLSGYEVDFGKDDMINEIAYVDLAWSGDALWAIEEAEAIGMTLDYFTPEIGANVWFDGWAIPTVAPNPLAAMMFVDFINRPDSAMLNSMAIGYTSAVAKELLQNDEDALAILIDNEYEPDDFFGDERRYPTVDETFGVMHDFGKANDTVVAMWERAKAGSGIPMSLVYTLIVLAVIIAGLILAYVIKEKVKLRKKVETE